MTEARTRPVPGGFGSYRFDAVSLDARYVLVLVWHSGFLFSPRYYDEVLELGERKGVQPDSGIELADPTNYGAFGFALYDRGRTSASVIHEAPLVRSGSDRWYPNLHAGQPGIDPDPPAIGITLGAGEDRVVREEDALYRIEFSDRSKWTRSVVEGELTVRRLTSGSEVIPLSTADASESIQKHAWQILASRTDVSGRIEWTEPLTRRRRKMRFEGLGYVDRTIGQLPASPDFGRWLWGRFQGSERTIAYYRLDPVSAAVADDPSPNGDEDAGHFLFNGDRSGGRIIDGGRLEPSRIRRNRWGMPHPLVICGVGAGEEWKAEVVRVVDRGPFYLRCLSRLSCDDKALDGVLGITECFLPARWDVPLYRLITQARIRRGP